MDPYETPKSESGSSETDYTGPKVRGCPACGSSNTATDVLIRHKSGSLFLILFGWPYLLVKGALSKVTAECRNCGTTFRYRTTGSWAALILLVVFFLWLLGGLDIGI